MQGVGWLTTRGAACGARTARSLTHGASTYKMPTLGECPPDLRVAFLERAAEPGVVHGSKAVGEPPLMLAISVREALRDAVAAFGAGGIVELASPATPEAVFWAIERASAECATTPESCRRQLHSAGPSVAEQTPASRPSLRTTCGRRTAGSA